MRVGIFTDCYPPVQNGISVSVETLVGELRRRNHRVVLVAPHHPDQADGSKFVIRVPSLLTPLNPYPLPYPAPPQVHRRLGRVPPHIIHSHSPFVLGRMALQVARGAGVPLVSTYHTLYNHYAHYVLILPHRAVEHLLEWLLPDYYNQCACVLAPSRVAEASLRRYGVTARVRVLPTGVPLAAPDALTDEARRAARRKAGVADSAPLLLFVGRVAPEKNVELVVKAFSLAARKHPGLRLAVAGAGPNLEACQKLADELPCGNRIAFLGAVGHNELVRMYAAADLFVFGSSTETQGLVVAEARAAGCPCIVVDEGGACETVADGVDGCIVPADEGAFAAAIAAVVTNPDRLAAMRAACLRRAPEFTPEAMADQVLAEYGRAIDEYPRPA